MKEKYLIFRIVLLCLILTSSLFANESNMAKTAAPMALYGSYNLIDADADVTLFQLAASNTINRDVYSQQLNVDALPPNSAAQSVVFSTNTGYVRTENLAPYALYGNNGTNFYGKDPDLGILVLTIKYYSARNGGGGLLGTDVITLNYIEGEVLYGTLELIDAETENVVTILGSSNEIAYSVAGNMSINAIPPSADTKSIGFDYTGYSKTESSAPYAMYGNSGNNYYGKKIPDGTTTLTVTYYSAASRGGSVLGTDVLTISVEAPPAPSATSLVFVFDAAGNQKMRRPPSQSTALKVKLPVEEEFEPYGEAEAEEESFENSIAIYPNPTNGDLAMTWEATYDRLIRDITVMDMGNRTIHVGYIEGDREVRVDLTRYPAGVYLVHFSLTDGTTVIKKIIKQ